MRRWKEWNREIGGSTGTTVLADHFGSHDMDFMLGTTKQVSHCSSPTVLVAGTRRHVLVLTTAEAYMLMLQTHSPLHCGVLTKSGHPGIVSLVRKDPFHLSPSDAHITTVKDGQHDRIIQ